MPNWKSLHIGNRKKKIDLIFNRHIVFCSTNSGPFSKGSFGVAAEPIE